MMDIKKAAIAAPVLIALLCAGCKVATKEEIEARQKLRIELFEKCMRLLPKGPERTVYSDWDEVVSECGTQAYYMSN